jgi:hypothetical protein
MAATADYPMTMLDNSFLGQGGQEGGQREREEGGDRTVLSILMDDSRQMR